MDDIPKILSTRLVMIGGKHVYQEVKIQIVENEFEWLSLEEFQYRYNLERNCPLDGDL